MTQLGGRLFCYWIFDWKDHCKCVCKFSGCKVCHVTNAESEFRGIRPRTCHYESELLVWFLFSVLMVWRIGLILHRSLSAECLETVALLSLYSTPTNRWPFLVCPSLVSHCGGTSGTRRNITRDQDRVWPFTVQVGRYKSSASRIIIASFWCRHLSHAWSPLTVFIWSTVVSVILKW